MAVRVASAYSTMSAPALMVMVEIPPINLIATEREKSVK